MYRVGVVVVLLTLGVGQSAFAQVTNCNGSTNLGFRATISNTPSTTTSATYVALPGASVTLSVPAASTRTFIVSFSGETRLIGNAQPPAGSANWIELQVRDNGQAMQPQEAGSPLAFASANLYQSNAATFCGTFSNTTGSTVNHTVAVYWKVVGGTGLTGWLDDWALRVEKYK